VNKNDSERTDATTVRTIISVYSFKSDPDDDSRSFNRAPMILNKLMGMSAKDIHFLNIDGPAVRASDVRSWKLSNVVGHWMVNRKFIILSSSVLQKAH
jgi:hypothetical protein